MSDSISIESLQKIIDQYDKDINQLRITAVLAEIKKEDVKDTYAKREGLIKERNKVVEQLLKIKEEGDKI